jgi:uncharacterized membrane protein
MMAAPEALIIGERRETDRRTDGWLITAGLSLLVALLATSTPWLGPGLTEIVMNLFSGVCHQLPNRSPFIDGVQLAVCHRCMGIYWAMPIAAVVFRLAGGAWNLSGRSAPLLLGAAALPAAIDWGGDILGWWVNSPASRVLTGSVFGLVAGYALARAVQDIVRNRRRNRASWPKR